MPWFHPISSEIHWILQEHRRIRVDFTPFPPFSVVSAVILCRSGKSPKKASITNRKWKIPEPSPRSPLCGWGFLLVVSRYRMRKFLVRRFFLNVHFQDLGSAAKVVWIVAIYFIFLRYGVKLQLKNFWCIIYIESEREVKTAWNTFKKLRERRFTHGRIVHE